MSAAISLYVGINETRWNHHPVATGPLACIAPVYGATIKTKKENCVRVPDDADVYEDSGAFSDGPGQRLSFADALTRQIEHAKKYEYIRQVRALASYDLLIDEKWSNGSRSKIRWSESEAVAAVSETVDAARFLSAHRGDVPAGAKLILSAQGVTPAQYLECAQRIAPFFDGDVLGLGGWCILGKRPSLMSSFRETIRLVVPFAAQFTKRIHIWGMCYAPALGELLWMCDRYGIELSTDSSGPQVRPTRGDWGYMGWRDPDYKRAPVETRGLDRARHVKATRAWLADFRSLEWYREPKKGKGEQLCLF